MFVYVCGYRGSHGASSVQTSSVPHPLLSAPHKQRRGSVAGKMRFLSEPQRETERERDKWRPEGIVYFASRVCCCRDGLIGRLACCCEALPEEYTVRGLAGHNHSTAML